MSDKTTELLNALAIKLGTTAEHLWGILVKQAFLDGVVSCFQYAALLAAWYVTYRVLKNWNVIFESAAKNDLERPLVFVGLVLFPALVIYSVSAFCYLSVFFSAFFNPEYWALHQVLNAVHK